MTETNVFQLAQPGTFTDSLTEVLRNGARALLTRAVEAEVADFLAKHADVKIDDGRQRLVRHGHLPEREIATGIGTVAVRQPRVRDRQAGPGAGERIRFAPTILPPYARRTKSLDVLIPILYLKGISTGRLLRMCWPAPSWARMRPASRHRPSAGSKRRGPGSMCSRASATSRPNGTSTSGPTAFTRKLGWRTRRSASWSSSGQPRKARRNSSASPTACARARNPGASCCSISGVAVSRLPPSSLSPTERSASGRRLAKCGRRRASSAAGCTRPPTSSTSCPRACTRKPSARCSRSGWPRPRTTRCSRSMSSSAPTARSTRKPPNA